MIMVNPAAARPGEEAAVLAVVVTIAKGYDLGSGPGKPKTPPPSALQALGRTRRDVPGGPAAGQPGRAGVPASLRFGITRTGYHGTRIDGREPGRFEPAGLIVTSWLQGTSRDGDPQDHIHNQIARVTRTFRDGKWRALDTDERAWGAGTGDQVREKERELAQAWERKHGRAPTSRELLHIANAATLQSREGKDAGAIDWDALARRWDATLGGDLAGIAPNGVPTHAARVRRQASITRAGRRPDRPRPRPRPGR